MTTDAPDPGVVYSLYRQGCARLSAGDPHGAAEVLELVVEHEPQQASVREALGRAYFRSRRPEAARGQFQRALAFDPSDDYAHFGLGRCYERQGQLAEAAKHLKLACALAPKEDYQRALERVQHRLSVSGGEWGWPRS